MISRKDLVQALRVLHEDDQINKIVTRAKRIDVHFMSDGRDCLLVLPNPQTNDNSNTSKNRTKSKPSTTKATTATANH